MPMVVLLRFRFGAFAEPYGHALECKLILKSLHVHCITSDSRCFRGGRRGTSGRLRILEEIFKLVDVELATDCIPQMLDVLLQSSLYILKDFRILFEQAVSYRGHALQSTGKFPGRGH